MTRFLNNILAVSMLLCLIAYSLVAPSLVEARVQGDYFDVLPAIFLTLGMKLLFENGLEKDSIRAEKCAILATVTAIFFSILQSSYMFWKLGSLA